MKKNPTETVKLKNTGMQLNNAIENFNSRLNQAEEIVNSKTSHMKVSNQNRKKKIKRNEENLQDFWDTIKQKYTLYRNPRRAGNGRKFILRNNR